MMIRLRTASTLGLLCFIGCNGDSGDSGQFGSGTEDSTSSAPTATGSGEETGNTAGTTGATSAASGATTDEPIFDLGNGTGSVEVCGEPEDNPIYLLTRGLETGAATSIQAFDPETLTFTPVVATIECAGTGADWGVSSMAVDRNRGAWIGSPVLPEGGGPSYTRLDRVDLDTGACETEADVVPQSWGSQLGMAFVADGKDSGNETLYFVNTGTFLHTMPHEDPLGRWWTLGPENRTFSGVELTGSGDGRMFSLVMNYTGPFDHECTARMPCPPTVRLAEVDKSDASALSMFDLPGIEAFGIDPGGFAFAYWGGHIWIFISRDFGPTQVFDHDPQTQTTTAVLDDGPLGVVGAGVSTCAPLVFPEG